MTERQKIIINNKTNVTTILVWQVFTSIKNKSKIIIRITVWTFDKWIGPHCALLVRPLSAFGALNPFFARF